MPRTPYFEDLFTCLTPEVGGLVYALNAEFVKQGL